MAVFSPFLAAGKPPGITDKALKPADRDTDNHYRETACVRALLAHLRASAAGCYDTRQQAGIGIASAESSAIMG